MRISIWDIDNCLSDDSHRLHLIDNSKRGDEKYAAYNALMHLDPVCNLSIFTVFKKMSQPIFFTGRPERFREVTKQWIRDNLGVENVILVMRKNDTVGITPVMLKQSMLLRTITEFGRGEIIGAFDDIPAVVEMYQRHRIPACVLQVHANLQLAYPPEDLK